MPSALPPHATSPPQVDLDWEYPGIPVLGGRPSDRPGLAALVREWRAAIRASGKPFILSIDTPQVGNRRNLPPVPQL